MDVKYFIQLRDVPISSWDAMEKLSSNGTVSQYLIEEYDAFKGPDLQPESHWIVRTMAFPDNESYTRFYLTWM